MRHRKRRDQLKVSPSHKRAMRRNLVASLFEHGQVTTTVAKAKAFRPFAEKLITIARRGIAAKAGGSAEGVAAHLHAVRRAQQLLVSKSAVFDLFHNVAPAAADRAGGYTRILRTGVDRLGDKAPLAMLMLVDGLAGDEAEGSSDAESAEETAAAK